MSDAEKAELYARLEALELRVRALEADGPELPPECRARACGYFTHYLAQGPAELTHEGYHAAEARCAAEQQRVEDWMDAHPHAGPERFKQASRQTEYWEKKIRA